MRESITVSIVQMDATLFDEAIKTASSQRLRATDSIYVALAHQLGVPLVSWDKEQLQRSSSMIEAYTPDSYPF